MTAIIQKLLPGMETKHFEVVRHIVPGAFIRQHRRATINKHDTVKLAVKEYRSKYGSRDGDNGITIVGAHANGFPKELYEPLWDDLFEALRGKGLTINNVIFADIACQGESGLLNTDILGDDLSWLDHPRDLFIIIHHLRASVKGPIVGVGHSMGGNNLINLSLMHPKLFSALILLDPGVQPVHRNPQIIYTAHLSVGRCTTWPSRSEAMSAFKKSKMFQPWDHRVFNLWMQYGIRDVPEGNGAVELVTRRDQEMFTFVRWDRTAIEKDVKSADAKLVENIDVMPYFSRQSANVNFDNLGKLQPSSLFIHGGDSAVSPPAVRRARIDATLAGREKGARKSIRDVKEVVLDGIGHLIPMLVPGQTADAIAEWLPGELRRVQEMEDEDLKAWEGLPPEARSRLSEKAALLLKHGKQPAGVIKGKF